MSLGNGTTNGLTTPPDVATFTTLSGPTGLLASPPAGRATALDAPGSMLFEVGGKWGGSLGAFSSESDLLAFLAGADTSSLTDKLVTAVVGGLLWSWDIVSGNLIPLVTNSGPAVPTTYQGRLWVSASGAVYAWDEVAGRYRQKPEAVKPSRIKAYLDSLDHTTPVFSAGAPSEISSSTFGNSPFANAVAYPLGATSSSASQPVNVTPGVPLNRGSSWPSSKYVEAGIIPGGHTQYAYYRPVYSFVTTSNTFAVMFHASTTTPVISMRINGKYYTWTETTTVGAFRNLVVTMGDGPNYVEILRCQRVVTFWFDSAATFSPWRRDVSVSCIGDSITSGASVYGHEDSWLSYFCAALGAEQRNYAIGGSGFFTGNDNQGESTAFRSRISIAATPRPTYQVWFGGWNDGTQSEHAIYNEIVYCISEFSRISPSTVHIIIGSWNTANGNASTARRNAELREAAINTGSHFVDLLTQAGLYESLPASPVASDGIAAITANGVGVTYGSPENRAGSQTQKPNSLVTLANASVMIQAESTPTHPTVMGQKALASRVLADLLTTD